MANLKHAPQLSLESIIQRNKEEASRLLDENARIEAEITKILSTPPPASKATTLQPPDSTRLSAEKEVIYAALAIVRSWQRRHKKNYHSQERELMNAVERLTWEK
jgi:hypothetical protein